MSYLSTSLCLISNIVDDLPGKQLVALGEVTTQNLVSTIMFIFVQGIKYMIWYISQNYYQFVLKMYRMVMSPHIILFLAIALKAPDATSYSIDEKSVDRTSIPGAKYLNQNLYSWFQKIWNFMSTTYKYITWIYPQGNRRQEKSFVSIWNQNGTVLGSRPKESAKDIPNGQRKNAKRVAIYVKIQN